MKRLIKYSEVDAKISRFTLNKFRNHLWYLSEELVVLSFFDSKVQPSEKMKKVFALNEECHDKLMKTPYPNLNKFESKTLSSFVSTRTKESLKLWP